MLKQVNPPPIESIDIDELLASFRQDEFYRQMQLQKGDKIVVAMSGGVDSSVTAALLHYAGFEVIGLTLQLYNHGEMVQRKKACCAGQDIYDAKQAAAKIGIPHYVMDMESRFREKVMQDFADSYARGETPIPCVRCNQSVKFEDLLEFSQSLQAKALATGHYIQRQLDETTQQPVILEGRDKKKDQSYFLFATTKTQLDYLRFPLGGLDKEDTRRLADYFNLAVADKPDSQDICFVPNGNYASIVAALRPDAFIPGNIVDEAGNILGQHEGIAHFTIGQRKGIGIGGRKDAKLDENSRHKGQHQPLYVIELDAKCAQITVGPKERLAKHAIRINHANWLGKEDLEQHQSLPIWVKIRNNMKAVRATINIHREEEATHESIWVHFDEPQYGVSAGQACVIYNDHNPFNGDDLQLLGGGWIV